MGEKDYKLKPVMMLELENNYQTEATPGAASSLTKT